MVDWIWGMNFGLGVSLWDSWQVVWVRAKTPALLLLLGPFTFWAVCLAAAVW